MNVRIDLHRDRTGHWRVRLEGWRVPHVAARSLSAALALLSRLVEGAAWAQRRDELDEVRDARSALYVEEPPPVAPAPGDGDEVHVSGMVPSCR